MNSTDLDFSTPEKTLLHLEDAYRSDDFELARRCHNFEHAAELSLQHLHAAAADPAALADALETQWRQAERPDVAGVTTQIDAIDHYAGKFFVVTRHARHPDGRTFAQRLYMSHCENGWAVLFPVPLQQAAPPAKPWWALWR